MRLYTNNRGAWVGTQAEAKAQFGKDYALVDVPTSKDALMRWLNNCRVVSQAHAEAGEMSAHRVSVDLTADTPTAAPAMHESTLTKPHTWQTIKECAERAPLRDFPVAIAVYQNRINDIV
ncbi:MAG: hypothetical protein ACO23H_12750 [Alphaproteobacteria bacterium]